MIDRLPLNALRAFVFAARHESFKAAALDLHVTPGAVSRHVKQLETLLGAEIQIQVPPAIHVPKWRVGDFSFSGGLKP